MSTDFKNYLEQLQLEQLLEKLAASNPKALAKTVQHFTRKEAEKRDAIVTNYFGECGIDQMVDAVTKLLFTKPPLPANAKVLDLGAGSGLFTVKVANKVHAKLPSASFFAVDLTPAMLLSLIKKKAGIIAFVGIAENIKGSIEQARVYFKIPQRFDAIFSTLMLHHSTQPEKVFESIKTAVRTNGKAIVIDLCEHGFEEFRTEMGDVHLSFKPEDICRMARKYFSTVKVEKMSGICCKSSGRSAEIFIVTMRNPSQNSII